MTGADRLRLVAAREVRERLRARSFQITTVVLALAVVAAIVLPSLGDGDPPTVKVGHPGAPTAARRDAVAAAGRLAGVRVEPVAVPDRGAAERALGAGDVDLAVLDGPELVVKARPEEDSELARFAAAVSQSLGVQARLEQAGLSPEVASAAREAQPLPLRSLDPPDPERQRQAGPLGFMAAIVLFLMLLQYGGGGSSTAWWRRSRPVWSRWSSPPCAPRSCWPGRCSASAPWPWGRACCSPSPHSSPSGQSAQTTSLTARRPPPRRRCCGS